MATLRINKGQYRVSDFISWQRDGSLVLSPDFQRRSVWKKGHKSFLIDTILRGLPVPIIFLRDRPSDRNVLRPLREVVDGQQRLRTILAYVAPDLLPDLEDRDRFVISKAHSEAFAGMSFDRLPTAQRQDILDYEFSVHSLPADTGDKLVLQMFARMNSSGYTLNAQELRNAEFFGYFKSAAYELATEQLDRWRAWQVFDSDQIARMNEVELMSEFMMLVTHGAMGTTKTAIDTAYRKYEEEFVAVEVVGRRIRQVFEEIDERFGQALVVELFSRRTLFYGLVATLYGIMYGLMDPVPFKNAAPKLPKQKATALTGAVRDHIIAAGKRIAAGTVPSKLAAGLRGATKDVGRRRTLISFLAGPEHDPCKRIR